MFVNRACSEFRRTTHCLRHLGRRQCCVCGGVIQSWSSVADDIIETGPGVLGGNRHRHLFNLYWVLVTACQEATTNMKGMRAPGVVVSILNPQCGILQASSDPDLNQTITCITLMLP